MAPSKRSILIAAGTPGSVDFCDDPYSDEAMGTLIRELWTAGISKVNLRPGKHHTIVISWKG